jgi:hypothetical protein
MYALPSIRMLYITDVYISIEIVKMLCFHPKHVQTDDERFSQKDGIHLCKAIQREEVSSLVPAGFAVIHHPPLRACSCPQHRPPDQLGGPAPTRPQAASPIFRAALVQTSAFAPPFPLRAAPLQGWGYPSAWADHTIRRLPSLLLNRSGASVVRKQGCGSSL